MNDQQTRTILAQLDAVHELKCDGRMLMFNRDFGTDVITIRGSSSKEHVVRVGEDRLCDYLNELRLPITEALVIQTLCDMYERPGHYGIPRLKS